MIRKNHRIRAYIIGGEISSEMTAIRTLAEVGLILGLSAGRVEQLEKEALTKIYDAFKVERNEINPCPVADGKSLPRPHRL